jgi:NAD(P)-dependent dehydrogenase (short-subunit alcohol dehydrogenase family)
MTILREDVLAGTAVALGGRSGTGALEQRLMSLGAALRNIELTDAADDERAVEIVRGLGSLDALVHDAGPSFAAGGPAALTAALETAWRTIAAVANGALIESGKGKVVLIAPLAEAGPHAEAARAALENLTRTLSIEWARYRITCTTILPGAGCNDDQLAEFVGFLLSAAGDYYSGCRFELG